MEEKEFYQFKGSYQPTEISPVCANIQNQLPDMMEGCLDKVSEEIVQAHLSVCYLCEKVWIEMQKTVALIESLPTADMIQDLTPKILSELEKEIERTIPIPWWKKYF